MDGETAAQIGQGIETGRIDPVDLTEEYLAAIAGHALGPRIYARLTAERARAEAQAARDRARAGVRRHPLDGVPLSWKDLFDTAGVATESGSALLTGRVPERDAVVLARASRAGLVCLGKTHQTELAFSGLGVNPVTATPPNRHDPALCPGGSSSGAAASVAFGLAAAAVGSDTGGSVRLPAAWNDLVGLKTTAGLLPLDGVVPLCPRFDTVGPLTRTVADGALVFSALAGERPVDLANVAGGTTGGGSVAGLRLLLAASDALPAIDDAPQAAFEGAVERLSHAGAHIETADVPEIAEAMALAGVLFAPEAYATWRGEIEAMPAAMFAPVRERFRSGGAVAAVDFIDGWRRLVALRTAWVSRVAAFDAVLIPSVATLPPPAAPLETDHAAFTAANLAALRNTRVGNLLGLCALTLPTGVPMCGLMVMAPPLAEARLLRIGAALERALA
jgi:aspartyl-tRNA(Asn)/glutamyl-tRNA(Gln) amidotransferase subunit A